MNSIPLALHRWAMWRQLWVGIFLGGGAVLLLVWLGFIAIGFPASDASREYQEVLLLIGQGLAAPAAASVICAVGLQVSKRRYKVTYTPKGDVGRSKPSTDAT